jgi:osmotically-inducible protein OsmY
MKSDSQIQKDVMEELKWTPYLKASEIGVSVKGGIVTLSGITDSYYKKLEVEKAAKGVAGVKAVAMDIQIGMSPVYKKTDTEIAQAVMNALKWHSAIREEKIKVKVEDGNVKLEGEVDWDFQRSKAVTAVENLTGVRSVINLITVKPHTTPADVLHKINAAFHRSATIDASRIKAEVIGNKVILKGTVRSFIEKEDAERAAWFAPGINKVENKLHIEIPEYAYEEEF